ncbi:hypothetical protein RF11_03892 [Thelohanellus kitauei]|uniref:Uncharacterized protein n=1 Tax=Thelohanellus kitauei TaxID=669202 RepID=A0A0C2IGN7_THEKT|nr:hypothetical protein RF11_03892 [Thelohanellus kitauei]
MGTTVHNLVEEATLSARTAKSFSKNTVQDCVVVKIDKDKLEKTKYYHWYAVGQKCGADASYYIALVVVGPGSIIKVDIKGYNCINEGFFDEKFDMDQQTETVHDGKSCSWEGPRWGRIAETHAHNELLWPRETKASCQRVPRSSPGGLVWWRWEVSTLPPEFETNDAQPAVAVRRFC